MSYCSGISNWPYKISPIIAKTPDALLRWVWPHSSLRVVRAFSCCANHLKGNEAGVGRFCLNFNKLNITLIHTVATEMITTAIPKNIKLQL
eukprot:1303428-Amphidinium_carterae.1